MSHAREFRAALIAGDEKKATEWAKGWQYGSASPVRVTANSAAARTEAVMKILGITYPFLSERR